MQAHNTVITTRTIVVNCRGNGLFHLLFFAVTPRELVKASNSTCRAFLEEIDLFLRVVVLDLDLNSYRAGTIFLAIIATELGERSANKTCTLEGVICTVRYCTGLIKNWLKTF